MFGFYCIAWARNAGSEPGDPPCVIQGQVLDSYGKPAAEEKNPVSWGAGITSGGGADGKLPSLPLLPLAVTTDSIQPSPISLGHMVSVQLTVRNTSADVSVSIPAMRPRFSSPKPDAPSGRMMFFCVRIKVPPGGAFNDLCTSGVGWDGHLHDLSSAGWKPDCEIRIVSSRVRRTQTGVFGRARPRTGGGDRLFNG